MEGRYRRVVDLVELTDLLQVRGAGLTIDDIAERFVVSRRTAERMLRALRERYPELVSDTHDGRKYWHLRGPGRSVSVEPAADAWTSARAIADGLAQRVNEPLTALLLAAEREDAHGEVCRLALRMRRVLERSLQLFHPEELKPEPAEASALLAAVTEAARPLAREARVELTPLLSGAKPWFDADRAQLTRALFALLENAIEASPPGGRVRIEASAGEHPGGQRFQVDDEGPGVDPACRDRIFEPYFTTREQAAGLGLAIARSIARRHGGRVMLIETAGPGASFVLEVGSPHGALSEGSLETGSADA
jgi:signal transduction histidine kinase